MKRTQRVGKSSGKNKTKMKVYNSREAKKIAVKNGWKFNHIRGNHSYYVHPDYTIKLCIGKPLNRMIWERCVAEYGLDLNL